MKTYCVVGIDTGIGKTQAVGHLAREALLRCEGVITFKPVQTGCLGISEDILRHRQIMGVGVMDEDVNGLTCPYVFPYPASPHFAAEKQSRAIDPRVMDNCLKSLEQSYSQVIMEGAGGLMVPLTRDLLLIDYLAERKIPVILVTSGRLGSLNHTLLSLEALKLRAIPLLGLIFNLHQESSREISLETQRFLKSQCYGLPFRILSGSGFMD